MKRPWEVDRRTFLRGAGTLIGLPLLEAMIPGSRTARADDGTPKRLVIFVFEGGTPEHYIARPGCFKPSTTGTDYELTPILQPFADLRDDILVISNLHNSVSQPVPDPPTGDHGRAMYGLLSGVFVENADGPDTIGGITVDQVAANTLKTFTPGLPSMSMETTGYYASLPICWSGPTSPIYPMQKPSDVFYQVFGDPNVDELTALKRLEYRKSVMHHAKEDADRLRKKLGKADQQKLDEYLTSVLSLEEKLAAEAKACSAGDYSTLDDTDIPGLTTQMLDLTTLALQCDRTRVAVFFLNLASSRVEWLGDPFGTLDWHNEVQHGAGITEGDEREQRIDMYVAGCAWQMEQFAYLLRKLKEIPEGEGNVLDNSVVLCASDMGYGDGHPMDHLPVIVAGRGGGAVNPGRHIEVEEQPIANLYVTMLNAVGVPTESFGNSTGALSLT